MEIPCLTPPCMTLKVRTIEIEGSSETCINDVRVGDSIEICITATPVPGTGRCTFDATITYNSDRSETLSNISPSTDFPLTYENASGADPRVTLEITRSLDSATATMCGQIRCESVIKPESGSWTADDDGDPQDSDTSD